MSHLIFDIETVPDRKMMQEMSYRDNSHQLPPNVQKISNIAWVILDDFYRVQFVGSTCENQIEADVISTFFAEIERAQTPRIVTYNGRMLDIPVLLARSMRHGIQAKWYYSTQQGRFPTYRTRHNTMYQVDLCDYLAEFGACKKQSLNLWCKTIGAPGISGVSDSDIARLESSGDKLAVKIHNISEVLNTTLLYFRLLHNQGELPSDMYIARVKEFLALLEEQSETTDHNYGGFLKLIDPKKLFKCN